MKNLTISAVLILLLSACMTMNKRECQAGEWQAAGVEDATRGRTDNHFNAHVKACAKHSVAADKPLYDQGYREGLQSYCQTSNGIRQGRETNDYRGICPTTTEQGFLRGYIKGLEITLSELERHHDGARDDIRSLQYFRLQADSAEDQRRINRKIDNLQAKIRDINQERANISATIAQWKDQL